MKDEAKAALEIFDDSFIQELEYLGYDEYGFTKNEVKFLRTALERPTTTVSAWQDISIAPYDVPILISGSAPQFVGVKRKADWGDYYSLSGSDCQTGCGETGDPTHWQPLPPAPKGRDDA